MIVGFNGKPGNGKSSLEHGFDLTIVSQKNEVAICPEIRERKLSSQCGNKCIYM